MTWRVLIFSLWRGQFEKSILFQCPRFNAGSLAVAIDLGEASDIHPLRKREVTERCVLAFQNAVFGKKNKLSPEPVAARCVDGTVVITMDQPLRPCDDLKEFDHPATS